MKTGPKARVEAPGPRAVRAGLILLLALSLAAAASAQLASKGLLDIKQDLAQREADQKAADLKASTEVWTPAKIMLNLDARCPVVTTLGYFGAYATTSADPAKAAELQKNWADLQTAAQPIAAELKQMATTTKFVGTDFPKTLTNRLNLLRAQLYGTVAHLYGDEALGELQTYVTTQAQGVVVGMDKSTTTTTAK